MLGYYIKSTIVFLIVYCAIKKIAGTFINNRKDIDYKKYKKEGMKGMYYTFCFVPGLRIFVLLIVLWVSVAKQEDLDKLLNKEDK